MRNNILHTTPAAALSRADGNERFIEKFGRALHRYGLPSHRIEASLRAVTKRLGFAGQFFATPTAIFASLEREEGGRTILIRVDPGEIHLEKVSRLDRLLMRVISGEMPVEELMGDGEDTPSGASAAYGLANWYNVNGDDEEALKHLNALVNTNSWAAFGFIAAEADLALR